MTNLPSAGGPHPGAVGGKVPRPSRKARRVARRQEAVEGADVVKDRIEASPEGGGVAVIDSKPGAVTFGDKAKGYYHTAIIIVTSILALLTEVGPIGEALGDPVKTWIAGAIVVIGIVLTFLKSNEVWVNRL